MTVTFEMLSAGLRSVFALWTLLICLALIGSSVLSATKKRFGFVLASSVPFAAAYYLWQVIFDFSLIAKAYTPSFVTVKLCALPVAYWLAACLALTAASVILLSLDIRYDRNYITPGAIKLFLDKMPCGVCCWRGNGRVLFSNICMNELCERLTDSPLLNGRHFHEAVKDGIITLDGRVWRFVTREMSVDGETLYETLASDITAEYAKTDALRKDEQELSRFNDELRQYYLSIDESVKRQEILQAKMNIHDEMNRLMLSTVAADREDMAALDSIFSLWEQNALLLCMQSDKNAEGKAEDSLDELAKALGVVVERSGKIPDGFERKQRELLNFTAQEALINAVKHAGAKKMTVSFEQTDGGFTVRFTNDGRKPDGEVRFEGGLKNIARLAESQGASVHTEVGENFSLIIKYQPIGG